MCEMDMMRPRIPRSLFRHCLLLFSMLIPLSAFAIGHAAAPVEQLTPTPAALTPVGMTFPLVVKVLKPANVRSGPGTNYPVISGAKPGQRLTVLGCNSDCTWYQLAEDCWIAAFLVKPEAPMVAQTTIAPQATVAPQVSMTTVVTSGLVSLPTVVVSIPVTVANTFVQTTRCPQTAIPTNTYAGPGFFFPIVDTRPAGECIAAVGRNTLGDWLQLSHGMWIEAAVIAYAEPIELLPITDRIFTATPEPTPTPFPIETPIPDIAQPERVSNNPNGNSQPFTCKGGCAVAPDPACNIKGNSNSGIYHTPSSRYYDRTDVNPEEGDRWFCTEDEARAAGYRPPYQ